MFKTTNTTNRKETDDTLLPASLHVAQIRPKIARKSPKTRPIQTPSLPPFSIDNLSIGKEGRRERKQRKRRESRCRKKIDEEDEEEKSFPDIGTRCGRGLAPHKSAERAGQRERERAREL